MQMVVGGCDAVPSPSSDDTVKNLGGYAVDRQQQQEDHGGGWGEQPWRKGVEWQWSKERWAAMEDVALGRSGYESFSEAM
jgi:hypothetical protein